MKKVTKIDKIQPSKAAKKKLRVAAYCRVSTDSDAQLESLETQMSHYKSYITARDEWEFAGLYFDEGITGTKASKRPQLMRKGYLKGDDEGKLNLDDNMLRILVINDRAGIYGE